MTFYVSRALGYICRVWRTDLTQLKFKYINKKDIVYGTNLYYKTVKQLMKFDNDNTGNKPIFVRKTATFSRLQLQKVTLLCRFDRSQLLENLLVPSSPINFRPGTGDSRFPGKSSTCLSKAVQHYATFRKTEILKLLGKPQISPRHL